MERGVVSRETDTVEEDNRTLWTQMMRKVWDSVDSSHEVGNGNITQMQVTIIIY